MLISARCPYICHPPDNLLLRTPSWPWNTALTESSFLTTVSWAMFYLSLAQTVRCGLGGRQVDSVIPAIWALDKICASPKIKAAQASGKLTVMFDSGIRTGSDIIKAIALGAQGVLSTLSQYVMLSVAHTSQQLHGRSCMDWLLVGKWALSKSSR